VLCSKGGGHGNRKTQHETSPIKRPEPVDEIQKGKFKRGGRKHRGQELDKKNDGHGSPHVVVGKKEENTPTAIKNKQSLSRPERQKIAAARQGK